MYIEAMPILLRSLALPTDYGHTMAKFLILCGPNSNPDPKLVFRMCRYNGLFIEDMVKGLTVPKWVLIYWPKMPQNISAQFVSLSPKFSVFDETSPKGFSSKCDVGNWIFSKSYKFFEKLFEIFLEYFNRIFWEKFFGRNPLGGIT